MKQPTDGQIQTMRELRQNGWSIEGIARVFKMAHGAVSWLVDSPHCYDCGTIFKPGLGYSTPGSDELFCSAACAGRFRAELGA